jgi:hypothetical protein
MGIAAFSMPAHHGSAWRGNREAYVHRDASSALGPFPPVRHWPQHGECYTAIGRNLSAAGIGRNASAVMGSDDGRRLAPFPKYAPTEEDEHEAEQSL